MHVLRSHHQPFFFTRSGGGFPGVCLTNWTFLISHVEVLGAPLPRAIATGRLPFSPLSFFIRCSLTWLIPPHHLTFLRYHSSSSLSRYSLLPCPPGPQSPFSIPGCLQGETVLLGTHAHAMTPSRDRMYVPWCSRRKGWNFPCTESSEELPLVLANNMLFILSAGKKNLPL